MSSALSAGDLTNLRASGHEYIGYLSIYTPSDVATALINQTSFAIPLAELTVDNTSGNWLTHVKAGMTAWIGTTSGARDVGVYRVRKTPGATTLYINELSSSDPGLLPLSDTQILSNNYYITVKKEYLPWTVFPRISYSGGVDARSGTFYKDYDTAYSDQTTSGGAVAGYVNIGNHRAGDGTATLTTSWTATATAWEGSVSSYLWDVDGGSITVGTTATQSITVEHSSGSNYIVSCTVTFSNGASVIARRYVFNSTPTKVRPLSDRRDQNGRKMRFELVDGLGSLDEGSFGLYWEEATFGDGNTISSATTQFAGWLQSYQGSSSPGETREEFELVSTSYIMQNQRSFPQQLVIKNTPSHWYELSESFSHIDYVVWYLLYYNSTVLTLHDFQPTSPTMTDYLDQAWGIQNAKFWQQLQDVGQRVNVNVGQDSAGTIWLRRNPMLMDTTDRGNVVERMTMTEVDVLNVTRQGNGRTRVGIVPATGFVYSGGEQTPLLAVASGHVSGIGSEEARLENQLVAPSGSGGQLELNARAASYYAMMNNPDGSLTIDTMPNYDVFEPAELYFCTLSVAAAYWHDGSAFSKRFIIDSITATHEGGGVKRIQLTVTTETDGNLANAETLNVGFPDSTDNAGIVDGTTLLTIPEFDSSGLLSFSYDPFAPVGTTSAGESITEETLLAYAYAGGGILTDSSDALDVSPTWASNQDVATFDTYSGIHEGAPDPASESVKLWSLWHDGTDSRVYYNSDALGVGSWSLKQTFTSELMQLLRSVAGVTNGIVVYPDWSDYTSAVADRLGSNGNSNMNLTFHDYGSPAAPVGSYNAGSDWYEGENIYPVEDSNYVFLFFVVPTGKGCIAASFDYDLTFETSGTRTQSLLFRTPDDASGGSLNTADETNTTTGTLSASGFYVPEGGAIEMRAGARSNGVSGTGLAKIVAASFTLTDARDAMYTGDNFSTTTSITVTGSGGDDEGGDVDDFNQGVIVMGAGRGIWYVDDYTDTQAVKLSGLAGIDYIDKVTCVRVPYKILATQVNNNTKTAMQFIYCTDAGYTGGVSFNASTGAINAESDMSIIIGGTTYYVVGKDGLETAGINTQIILACVKPVGGGDTKIVRSTNGGSTWAIVNTGDYSGVYFVPGSSYSAWFWGTDGIGSTANRGSTITARTGDFSGTPQYVRGFAS